MFQVQGSKLHCSFFADWMTGRWRLFSTRRNYKMTVNYPAPRSIRMKYPEPDDKLSEIQVDERGDVGRRVKVHNARYRGEHDERITPNLFSEFEEFSVFFLIRCADLELGRGYNG